MSRLLIDVTQLAEWQGKLTGIPRVMNELASRFATSGASLVVWDRAGQAFQTIEYDKLVQRRTGSLPAPEESLASGNFVRVAKAVEARAPLVQKVRRRTQAAIRRPSNSQTATSTSSQVVNSGDTLVVLWGHWHEPAYIHDLISLNDSGAKLVQFVYDMLPLVTPQFSGHSTEALSNYVTSIYPLCTLLLAISEYSKHDVADWLKQHQLHVPPIEVIRLGEDFVMSKPVKPHQHNFLDAGLKGDDFLLCVCTIEARKNHGLLYYTYKLAKQREVKLPKLVIVGRRGWLTDDIFTLMTTDPETKDDFIFLQDASDEELSWLYEHCLFSIYPSFYEGWGLPIAESAARGVPVIASNTSSMPEIAGQLIDYFSPYSSDECLAAITTLLNPAARATAAAKIKKYQSTNWDQTYKSVTIYIKEYTA